MAKQIILTVIAIVLIIGGGIFELVTINNKYEQFKIEVDNVAQLALDDKLTMKEIDSLQDKWKTLREQSEFIISHLDTTEMDIRMSEAYACVKVQDLDNAYKQLIIMSDLAEHIPHSAMPTPEHIF